MPSQEPFTCFLLSLFLLSSIHRKWVQSSKNELGHILSQNSFKSTDSFPVSLFVCNRLVQQRGPIKAKVLQHCFVLNLFRCQKLMDKMITSPVKQNDLMGECIGAGWFLLIYCAALKRSHPSSHPPFSQGTNLSALKFTVRETGPAGHRPRTWKCLKTLSTAVTEGATTQPKETRW